jgi:hypothetical protein
VTAAPAIRQSPRRNPPFVDDHRSLASPVSPLAIIGGEAGGAAIPSAFLRSPPPAIATAAHPGTAATNLQAETGALIGLMVPLLGQSQAMGALPILYAATAPDVHGNDYLGPNRFLEMRGHPSKVGGSAAARSEGIAEQLWELSLQATGVDYGALKQPA